MTIKLFPTEKAIQRQCLDWLNLQPHCLAIRINSGAVRGEYKGKTRFFQLNNQPGCSDIIGVVKRTLPWGMASTWIGQFFALEIKRPLAEPTAPQRAFLDKVQALGGLAVCIHSLDELQEFFKEKGLIDAT